jgi:biotin synthase-related radical SAM superfamily protein
MICQLAFRFIPQTHPQQAGATEIKYNVETMNLEIFVRICPGLSLEYVLTSLEKAVKFFGKNKVTSNFILGLGESDECVLAGVTRLAEIGMIPILRPISSHPLRKRRSRGREAIRREAS